eukprot:324259-Rhodomonas_salina.5
MLSTEQSTHHFTLAYHEPDPKNTRQARASPKSEEWRQAEWVELKTICDMGTFEIVDRQPNTRTLPSMMTYKTKYDKLSNVLQYKCSLVARGDLQNSSEYNETYSQTAKFTAIWSIISVATEEDMELYQ